MTTWVYPGLLIDLKTPGLEAPVISKTTSPSPKTSKTSAKYLLLNAILDSSSISPSTLASISPWFSPSSSALEEIDNPADSPLPTIWILTIPLPSLAKIDAGLTALVKS